MDAFSFYCQGIFERGEGSREGGAGEQKLQVRLSLRVPLWSEEFVHQSFANCLGSRRASIWELYLPPHNLCSFFSLQVSVCPSPIFF